MEGIPFLGRERVLTTDNYNNDFYDRYDDHDDHDDRGGRDVRDGRISYGNYGDYGSYDGYDGYGSRDDYDDRDDYDGYYSYDDYDGDGSRILEDRVSFEPEIDGSEGDARERTASRGISDDERNDVENERYERVKSEIEKSNVILPGGDVVNLGGSRHFRNGRMHAVIGNAFRYGLYGNPNDLSKAVYFYLLAYRERHYEVTRHLYEFFGDLFSDQFKELHTKSEKRTRERFRIVRERWEEDEKIKRRLGKFGPSSSEPSSLLPSASTSSLPLISSF